MTDIDALSIRISASTGVAVRNINNLASALRTLNEELNRVNPSGIESVVRAASGMSNAFSGMRSSGRAVRDITQNLANMVQEGGNVSQVGDAARNMSLAMNDATQNTNGAADALVRTATQTQTLGNGLQNVSNNARSASRSMRQMSSSASSSNSSFKGLTKELTRVGKMLKLMITRMVLRKVIQGVIDGFKNLAQYSSTFDSTLSLLWNSLRQLGNAIAAAVSPLLNALAPALNYIIQLVIKVVNVINQLISALTGLGTWTRAKTLTDDYAKSLDKSNKSAKALKKTVLGFDELNQLQDNNSGGGGGGTSPADMFEQSPIDPRILKAIDDFKKKVGELKPYWDSFKKGFSKGLGEDWQDKVDLITDGIGRIKKAAKDIWDDPEVSKAREEFLTSFSEAAGAVAGTGARIGLNVGANFAQGVANSIEEKSPEIKEYATEMFNIGTDVSKQVEDFSLAVGEISDVLVSDEAIGATTEFTNVYTEAFMLVTENAARLGDDILTLVTQPIIDNKDKIKEALQDMFSILEELGNFIQNVFKDLRDIMKDVWDAHLHPMFESLTEALSNLQAIVLKAWGYISPVFHEVIAVLKELWNTYLKPIADDIINIVGIVGNLIAKLFNSVIVPYIGSLVDKWMPRIRDGISILISIIKLAVQIVSTAFQQMTFVLRSFLQFFETGFTQGWSAACDQLAQSWSQHWDAMVEKLKGIANTIIEIVEKLINGIVHGINQVGEKIGDKLSNIKFPSWLGGDNLNISIPHLSDVSLPRFRSGGFPENGLFMANSSEMVGRFSNGKNAVANNEQITEGIARAVFNAMTSAQSSGSSQYINNTIMVDGDVIARAVTKGQERLNRRYSPTMA